MLYENYQKKMMRLARILAKCIKYFWLIAAVFAVIAIVVVTLLGFKGTVLKTACSDEIIYGDQLEYSASAFLSGVRFEFSPVESEDWSETIPKIPGKYKLRAQGNGVFGIKKYGNEVEFEIFKKDISVSIINSGMIYGDIPSVFADTAEGDTVICESYVYEDETLESVNVTPDTKYISVVSADGADVTNAYNISVVKSKVVLSKRPITVTVENAEAAYNGEKFSYDKYEITSGTLRDGDTLRAVFEQSLIYPGSVKNQPKLSIVDKNGKDVTECYKITEKIGELTVVKNPLIINTESATLIYDGVKRTFTGYTLDESSVLAKGHSIKAVGLTSVLDVGTYSNTLSFSVVDEQGKDMTEYYTFLINEGEIVVEPRMLTVKTPDVTWTYNGQSHYSSGPCEAIGLAEGHSATLRPTAFVVNVGEVENVCVAVITNENGFVVNEKNYEITYEYGTLKCEKRPITIRTGSTKKEYSGFSVTVSEYEIISEMGLLLGHKLRNIESTSVTLVGKVENVFKKLEIVDNYGEVKTENYEITYENGTIEITKRVLDVRTPTKSWVYDGQEHYDNNIWIILGTLGAGDTFIVESYPTITDVGTVVNKFQNYRIENKNTGEDRSANYELVFGWGELTVNKRPIIIKVPVSGGVYDGTVHYARDPVQSEETPYPLVEGHAMSAKTEGSRTDVGESVAEITEVKILDGAKDVTGNYEIIKENGKITVTPRWVVIRIGSAEKIYDREPLVQGEYNLSTNSILPHHILKIEIVGSQTEVGTSINTYNKDTLRVLEGEKDVTGNYSFIVKEGTLKVSYYGVVTLVAHSGEKIYDGTPLIKSGYLLYVIEGAVYPQHKISAQVYGSQTEVGSSKNTVTARILDEKGNDISFQYKILTEDGTLTVKGEEKEPERVVASIKTDKSSTLYLRKASYGDYSGRFWETGVSYLKTLSGGHNYNYLSALALKELEYPLHMAQIRTYEDFLLPYYAGTDGNYEIQSKDTAYYGERSEYVLTYYEAALFGGSPIYNDNFKLTREEELEYRDFVYKIYTSIDSATKSYFKNIVNHNGIHRTDHNVVDLVVEYINRTAKYNPDYDKALDNEYNVAPAFLGHYKEGDSRHFATAAVLMLRSLNIPARYVTGYKVETVAGQFVDVKSTEYAWIEVYYNSIGWVYVDVTPAEEEEQTPEKETISLTPAYVYKKYDGKLVFPEHRISPDSKLSDLLKQGYTYTTEIVNGRIDIGRTMTQVLKFQLFDPKGNEVTNEYNYRFNFGIVEVFPQDQKIIQVYMYALQKYYDGTSLTFEDGDFRIIEIEEGVDLTIKPKFSLTDAGCVTLAELNEKSKEYFDFTVTKNGADVTSEYAVVFVAPEEIAERYVPIRVDQRAIELTSASESKVYDGETLSNGNVTVTKGALLSGDTLHVTVNGAISEIGEMPNVIIPASVKITDQNGKDVTKNYKITIKNGTLSIIK